MADDLAAVLALLYGSDTLWTTVRAEGEGPLRGRAVPAHHAAFPGESLRVTAVFADGRRGFVGNFGPNPATGGGVTLAPVSGSGTQTRFDQRFWVEPLPPAGPLGLVVEWPSRGLGETLVDLDGGDILAAAARAEALWPDATT